MEGQKKRVTTKECKRLRKEFDAGGFMAQKELWPIAKKQECWKTEEPLLKKKEILSENIKLCMKMTLSAVG